MNSNAHGNNGEFDTEKGRVEYGPRTADPVSYQRLPSRVANPGPAGLFAFASTTFLLSLFNVNTRGIQTPNVIVGMAIFAGGLVQLLAGMWEFPRGNVFGATAFSMYGSFWMSYATIFIPSSGILDAYATDAELHNALGLYLMVWFMVTVMFILPVMRKKCCFYCPFINLGPCSPLPWNIRIHRKREGNKSRRRVWNHNWSGRILYWSQRVIGCGRERLYEGATRTFVVEMRMSS